MTSQAGPGRRELLRGSLRSWPHWMETLSAQGGDDIVAAWRDALLPARRFTSNAEPRPGRRSPTGWRASSGQASCCCSAARGDRQVLAARGARRTPVRRARRLRVRPPAGRGLPDLGELAGGAPAATIVLLDDAREQRRDPAARRDRSHAEPARDRDGRPRERRSAPRPAPSRGLVARPSAHGVRSRRPRALPRHVGRARRAVANGCARRTCDTRWPPSASEHPRVTAARIERLRHDAGLVTHLWPLLVASSVGVRMPVGLLNRYAVRHGGASSLPAELSAHLVRHDAGARFALLVRGRRRRDPGAATGSRGRSAGTSWPCGGGAPSAA